MRSDGKRALLVHVKAARAMTMVSDVSLESLQEQVSKQQSPWNGLAEGAVKELKTIIRILRQSAEMGLRRRILTTWHGWLCTRRWRSIGFGQGTLYEPRVGRKFRRLVAPW